MAYSLKDVDAAEALVRDIRPETITERGDFDWSLSVRDKDSRGSAIILFRPQMGEQSEISSTEEKIRDICFFLGGQWTAEEAAKLAAAARKWGASHPINRIQ